MKLPFNITQQVESFMAKDNRIQGKKEQQICAILPSDDQLTGRAGLSVFAMYLRNIGLFPMIDRLFGTVRKNGKGLAVTEMFVQILSFFMAGTSRHLNWFDHLKGTSKKCHERAECKADGAQKPECTHCSTRDFEHHPTKQSGRAIIF